MTLDVKAYLPDYKSITIYFLKDLISLCSQRTKSQRRVAVPRAVRQPPRRETLSQVFPHWNPCPPVALCSLAQIRLLGHISPRGSGARHVRSCCVLSMSAWVFCTNLLDMKKMWLNYGIAAFVGVKRRLLFRSKSSNFLQLH